MKEPDIYITHWNQFREYCEKRAKDADCYINNKGWQKLREYHLENYLKAIKHPFGFLFKIKFRYPHIYSQVKCMPRFYYRYARLNRERFESPVNKLITYPSWKGIFRSKS